jgi:hypothetical protein
LVNQVLFVADIPCQQIRYEQIRERVFPVKRKDHCLLINLQKLAGRHGGCRSHAESLTRKRTFSKKLSLAQYAEGCSRANLGYDREANLAFLDIEDGISRVPLREDCLFLGKDRSLPPLADGGKELPGVEVAFLFSCLLISARTACPRR